MTSSELKKPRSPSNRLLKNPCRRHRRRSAVRIACLLCVATIRSRRHCSPPSALRSASPRTILLRAIKELTERVLSKLSRTFAGMYSKTGRPSIPPERLLKAQILIALYTVRSDRMFCEQLDYNLLFRWFLDMTMDERPFDHSSFTKNRDRLLKHDVAGEFFSGEVDEARTLGLMSSEHFTIDGTLIDAWASLKSFRPKEETPEDRA